MAKNTSSLVTEGSVAECLPARRSTNTRCDHFCTLFHKHLEASQTLEKSKYFGTNSKGNSSRKISSLRSRSQFRPLKQYICPTTLCLPLTSQVSSLRLSSSPKYLPDGASYSRRHQDLQYCSSSRTPPIQNIKTS